MCTTISITYGGLYVSFLALLCPLYSLASKNSARNLIWRTNILHCQVKELEDKGKSMVCALYALQLAKGASLDKVMSKSGKSNP